jgi:hypothetical protein
MLLEEAQARLFGLLLLLDIKKYLQKNDRFLWKNKLPMVNVATFL